jgi:hypothetical protein
MATASMRKKMAMVESYVRYTSRGEFCMVPARPPTLLPPSLFLEEGRSGDGFPLERSLTAGCHAMQAAGRVSRGRVRCLTPPGWAGQKIATTTMYIQTYISCKVQAVCVGSECPQEQRGVLRTPRDAVHRVKYMAFT